MKLEVKGIHALPMDTEELSLLPPGELEVRIRFVCDKEALDRIKAFFRELRARAWEGANKDTRAFVEGERALPEAPDTPRLGDGS